jgi:hypothetical protein
MGLGGFGEMLPYYENKVYIDHSKKDKNVCLPLIANTKKMRKMQLMNDAAEMLEASGIKM